MADVFLSRRDCLKALLALPFLHSGEVLAAPSSERIVAINWLAAETLLSLGITPLAVSDSRYFRRRIATPRLPDGVQDVGPYWEPNIELLAALRPSLILSDILAPTLLASMRSVAPVQEVTVYPAKRDVWQALIQFTFELGQQLHITDTAAQWIQQATAAIDRCRAQVALAPAQRILVMVLSQDGKYATVYGRHSLADAVLTRLGLRNAWEAPVSAMGTANVGIEKLASLQADLLFYTELPTTLTQINRIRQPNVLWQQLPLVVQGNARQLTHFFPFGSLATAVNLAQHIAASIGEADSHD